MARILLLFLALSALAFAPAPLPKPDRRPGCADLRGMQGEWALVSYSLNGGTFVASRAGCTAVCDGNRLSHFSNGVVTARWVVTLDPSKEPKRMDLKHADAPGLTLLCIYKLDGDTLTCAFCNQANAPERPTDFNPHRLMGVEVFKRKKR